MENEGSSSNRGKKILQRSSNSHISMSDSESTASQVDSFHSPLRSESPLRLDDPYFEAGSDRVTARNTCTALVPVVKYYSENSTSENLQFQGDSPPAGGNGRGEHLPDEKFVSENVDFKAKGGEPVVVGFNKIVKDQGQPEVKKVGPVGRGGLEEGNVSSGEDEVGGERKSRAAVASILRRSERNVAARRAAMVFRVFELIACLISFSVMAANRTEGWSGDSFDRYTEYRYCLAVNIIGFVYSGFQAFDLAYNVSTGKHFISHHLRYHFDFSMDQLLAYFLMSASTSAATKVDDWITNWGSDKFTLMACASIGMSFLAFVAFSLSSLVSGCNLCNRNST